MLLGAKGNPEDGDLESQDSSTELWNPNRKFYCFEILALVACCLLLLAKRASQPDCPTNRMTFAFATETAYRAEVLRTAAR